MCEGKSESQRDEQLKAPVKVLQKQKKDEGEKENFALNSDDCCAPVCSPITCE